MAYINQEDLIKELEKLPAYFESGDIRYGIIIAIDMTKKQSVADAVEVRHAGWMPASTKQGVNCGMKCSLCGARIKYSEFFNGNHNYCHKCGAIMDGKD